LEVEIPENTVEPLIVMAVLNHLGGQGWELVLASDEAYTFKRRVR
jgi:hypothetical protein